MDLHALAGAYPLAALLLVVVYGPSRRIWGGDPVNIGLKTPWSGRRIVIALTVLAGVPLGWLSAGAGGALIPLLFLAWCAIVPSGNWATPRTTGEIAVAFVHNALPAIIVALTVFVCDKGGWTCPWGWLLAITLAAHASLATALAVRYAHTNDSLARQLAAGQISQSDCDQEIDDANAFTELAQSLSFAAAVIVWALHHHVPAS